MEQRHHPRLQECYAEERGAASREGNFLTEPRDDGEVERQQHCHRDGSLAAAKVDERAVGQRENDHSQDESIAPCDETEERAPAEDHQRYRVHRDGERVWKSSNRRQRGGHRQDQCGSDQRAAHLSR